MLHVARLARLELTEDEVERMSAELSKVLDHIETINELGDLSEVEPTSHVVTIENALRADEPRPCLPQEVALAQAPDVDRGGFRVPSPGARAGMTRRHATSPRPRRPRASARASWMPASCGTPTGRAPPPTS